MDFFISPNIQSAVLFFGIFLLAVSFFFLFIYYYRKGHHHECEKEECLTCKVIESIVSFIPIVSKEIFLLPFAFITLFKNPEKQRPVYLSSISSRAPPLFL